MQWHELQLKRIEKWRAIRKEAYEDPGTFVAFLRDKDNKDIFSEILSLLSGGGAEDAGALRFPKPLVDALADLLSTGTAAQRDELSAQIRGGSFNAGGAGPELMERCLERLSQEKDPSVLLTLLNTLHFADVPGFNGTAKIETRLGLLNEIWKTYPDKHFRSECLALLSRARTSDGQAMFVEKVSESLYGSDESFKPYILPNLGERLRTLPLGEEDRYLPLLTAAFATTKDAKTYLDYASMSLDLPLPKATLALGEARTRAPDNATRAALDRALSTIRSGETRAHVIINSLRNP